MNESTEGGVGDESPAPLSKIYIDEHIAERLGTTGTRTAAPKASAGTRGSGKRRLGRLRLDTLLWLCQP